MDAAEFDACLFAALHRQGEVPGAAVLTEFGTNDCGLLHVIANAFGGQVTVGKTGLRSWTARVFHEDRLHIAFDACGQVLEDGRLVARVREVMQIPSPAEIEASVDPGMDE